jgi:hypothetical protein
VDYFTSDGLALDHVRSGGAVPNYVGPERLAFDQVRRDHVPLRLGTAVILDRFQYAGAEQLIERPLDR